MLFIGVMPFGAITAYAANADTEEALVAAVNKGGTVKLSDDISLTDILRVPSVLIQERSLKRIIPTRMKNLRTP